MIRESLRQRSGFDAVLALNLILLALIIGAMLSSQNYVLILGLLVPLVFLFVWRTTLGALIGLSIFTFFGDWLAGLGIIPGQAMWALELLVVLLFIKALLKAVFDGRRLEFPFGWIMSAFLLTAFLSMYLNNGSPLNLLLFMRLVFMYYLMYVAVWNLGLSEKSIHRFLRLLLVLIVIQLPTAVVKLFIYGQGESAIGTYAVAGGTLSTVMPLIVIGFGFSLYLIHRRSWLYLALIMGAIAFSIIGGKRGFIFFLPACLIFLTWYMRNDIINLFRYTLVGSVVLVLAAFFALSLVPTLSPGYSERGSFNPRYAWGFMQDYTTNQMEGATLGRTSSTISLFLNLSERGILPLMFGVGPGSVMKSRFSGLDTRNRYMEEFSIMYGITGLNWLTMNVGCLGAGLVFLFLFVILRRCVAFFYAARDSYWRAFGLGMVGFSFIMILMNIMYAPVLITELAAMHFFTLVLFLALKQRADRRTSSADETTG